jgi:hypothetical protein
MFASDRIVPMDKGLLRFSNTAANANKMIDHSSTLVAARERLPEEKIS